MGLQKRIMYWWVREIDRGVSEGGRMDGIGGSKRRDGGSASV